MDESPNIWHALAMLRLDRPTGLAELEERFASGSPPEALDGPMRGRVLATTLGHGIDAVFEAIGRAWMPWKGKTLSAAKDEGRNLFTPGGIRATRMFFPTYRGARSDGPPTAFAFATRIGVSETHPATKVLQIDYRDLEENPRFPIRRILDELVRVEDDFYLGQALLLWRGKLRRAAWFSLEPRPPA